MGETASPWGNPAKMTRSDRYQHVQRAIRLLRRSGTLDPGIEDTLTEIASNLWLEMVKAGALVDPELCVTCGKVAAESRFGGLRSENGDVKCATCAHPRPRGGKGA